MATDPNLPVRNCDHLAPHRPHTWRPGWVAAVVHQCAGVTPADVFRQGLENAQEAWAAWLGHIATPPEPGAFRVRATIGEGPSQIAGPRVRAGVDYTRGGMLPHFTVETEGRITQNVPLKTTRVDDFRARVRTVNGLAADPASDTSATPAPSEVTALREQVARLEEELAIAHRNLDWHRRQTEQHRNAIHNSWLPEVRRLKRDRRKLAQRQARLHHAFHDTRRVLTTALASMEPPLTVPTTLDPMGLARIAQHLADHAWILQKRNEGLTDLIDTERRAHLEVTTSHVRLHQALQNRADAESNAVRSGARLVHAIGDALGIPPHEDHLIGARKIAADRAELQAQVTELRGHLDRSSDPWRSHVARALGAPTPDGRPDELVVHARALRDRLKAHEQILRRVADAAGMPGEYGWTYLVDSVRANRQQVIELRDMHPDGEIVPYEFRRRLAAALELATPPGSGPYSTDLLAAVERLRSRASHLAGRTQGLEIVRRNVATALGIASDDLDLVDVAAMARARLAEVGQPEPLFVPEAERALRLALQYPAGVAPSRIHHEYVEGMVVKTSYSVTGTSDRAVLKRLLADLAASGVRGTLQ